jgi:hypothetical protein
VLHERDRLATPPLCSEELSSFGERDVDHPSPG